MPFRVLVVVSVLTLGVGAGVLAHVRSDDPALDRSARGTAYAASVPPDEPLAVLHAWDGRRAAAWADGDPVALGKLYVAGSAARTADLRLLRHYTDRGLVVRQLRMQVLRSRVLVDRSRLVVVEVTERLAPARAARAGASRVLPAGRTTTHVVRFRRVGGQWLVASVSAPRGAPG